MSKRRRRQPLDAILDRRTAPLRGRELPEPEPRFLREDAMKIVPIGVNDAGSAKLDIADAIANEIDMTWAIIAVIEILLRESGDDKYAAHLAGLCAIQRDLDRVCQSE